MPVYQFRCPQCATLFEEKRTFARADDPAICPTCASDQAAKVISAAMFYAPGSAAKAMLAPGAGSQQPAADRHGCGPSCPCCSG